MEFKLLELQYVGKAVAFISEDGLTNQWGMILNRTDLSIFTTNYMSFPLVLRWAVKQGFTALPGNSSGQCPGDKLAAFARARIVFAGKRTKALRVIATPDTRATLTSPTDAKVTTHY